MRTQYTPMIGIALAFNSSCGSDSLRQADESDAPQLGSLYAAIEVSEVTEGISAVRLDIVPLGAPCSSEPTATEVVPLADTSLGSPEVHAFANGLFVLEVGSYRLCATPLDGSEASDVCAPVDTNVVVDGQTTTEVALVSQCLTADRGGVDVVISLNQAPIITLVELSPSRYIDECETLTVTATATDANGDPLSHDWSVASGPAGGSLLATDDVATFAAPPGEYSLRVEVDDGHGGIAELEFPVDVAASDCDPDTTPPSAVTELEASIVDRRETSMNLSWTAPNEVVAGYEIVYVKVAAGDSGTTITDENFDGAVPLETATGSTTTTLVHDLTIEQNYLFAVRPFDAAGNRGAVTALAEPIRARFETLVLDPPVSAPPGAQWGYSVDASTDLNGDGTADLVVGQKYGDVVSIYLGQPGLGFASEASATIVGPPGSGFGTSVAVVGNLIGDPLEDIAIAAPTDGPLLGRVYLVSGQSWDNGNLDLSDGDNPTGSIIDFPNTTPFPAHVVRLGDFDGDATLDFGLHALGYGRNGPCDPETLVDCDGALLIIKGSADPGDFPSVVTVPDDASRFEAYYPSVLGFYGNDWLLGITDLVGAQSGVLAAEYQGGLQRLITRDASLPNGFRSQSLAYGPPVYSNDDLVYDTEIGSYPAALTGSSTLAIQLTNARNGLGTSPGIIDLYSLSPTDTFSAPFKTLRAGGETNNFGQILIGTRYSGRPKGYNLPFFGRDPSASSLIAGGRFYANTLPKLFMLDADTIASIPENPSGQELTGVADVEYLLSDVPGLNPDWTDAIGVPSADADWHGGLGFPIHDMNGDGFADIGITEWDVEAAYTGGIIVLY